MKFDRDLARKLIADGVSQNEIARQLGIHKTTLSKWMARFGLRRERVPFTYSELMVSNIRKLRESGTMSYKQIAFIVGSHESTVRKICRQFAIVSPVKLRAGKKPISQEIRQQIITLTNEGVKQEAIAAIVGVTQQSVSKIVRQEALNVTKG